MKHSVPHDLEIDIARLATDAALNSYRERFSEYNPVVSWHDDKKASVSFKVKGMTLKGNFELTAAKILMELKVPLALKLFQKKALAVIEREIEQWVERARQGEFAKNGERETDAEESQSSIGQSDAKRSL